MGFMDKIKGMVNPDDGYDDFDEYDAQDGEGYDDNTYEQQSAPARSQNVAHQTYGGNGNAALELKVVRPERFDSVTQIADHLLNGRTVVLNLEATNKETARRMIDFLSGVAYSIEGNLKKVANTTYVITPGNVAVDNDGTERNGAQPANNGTEMYGNL
ncbi:MAG: cell division protein SepF [Clostridia bacterium]|nr:cell division protein SepF [Clostridia bacterium]